MISLEFGAFIVLFIKVVFGLRSYCELALILLGWLGHHIPDPSFYKNLIGWELSQVLSIWRCGSCDIAFLLLNLQLIDIFLLLLLDLGPQSDSTGNLLLSLLYI